MLEFHYRHRGLMSQEQTSSKVPTNQSVTKAISILRAVSSDPDGLTASAIARATGLPWATTSRLIRTLEQEGLAFRVNGDRYVLGLEVSRLARRTNHRLVLGSISHHLMLMLAEKVGETALLTAVRADGSLEVISQIEASQIIRMGQLHRAPPIHASAIGKILLSTYDHATLDEILRQPLRQYTPFTITDRDALERQLEEVVTTGYSVDVDELERGLSAVATGVYDDSHDLHAIVSIAGPTWRFDAEAREGAVPALLDTAKSLEKLVAASP